MASAWGDSWGVSWSYSWDIIVPPIPPPVPVILPAVPYTSGDGGRTTILDHDFKSERDRLEEQLLNEDNEILAIIIAITCS